MANVDLAEKLQLEDKDGDHVYFESLDERSAWGRVCLSINTNFGDEVWLTMEQEEQLLAWLQQRADTRALAAALARVHALAKELA
jgi:hypothetical protein